MWTVTWTAQPSVTLVTELQILSGTSLSTCRSLPSILGKVGGPVLMFEGERLKVFSRGFVLLLLRLLRRRRLRLLLWLLREREARGDASWGGAVAGGGPHRGLQHLHGVTPLRGRRDVHLKQGRAGIGHGVGVDGVLPRCLRRPGFRFAVLCRTRRKPSVILPGRKIGPGSAPWIRRSQPRQRQKRKERCAQLKLAWLSSAMWCSGGEGRVHASGSPQLCFLWTDAV